MIFTDLCDIRCEGSPLWGQGGVPPCSKLVQDRILELREQIALMDEPPLWPA